MIFKSIVGLLVVLLGCSGNSQSTKNGLPADSGLRIENGINRGITYTDSTGADYNLRYIPITIRNDSTTSVQLQITFSKEYTYSHLENSEKFKLIALPTEWAMIGVGVTERMMDELPNYIESPEFNITIAPDETYALSIGTLYPSPPKFSGVLPRTLFTHLSSELFPTCDWLINKEPSPNPPIPLGLKLVFGENCMIIPCGQVNYLQR